jgi:PAS domain S-box-containing protein
MDTLKNSLIQIIETGVRESSTPQERRSIILSNCLSIILCFASILIFLIISKNHTLKGFTDTLIVCFFFALPILLNRFYYITVSSLYLCVVPIAVILWFMISTMKKLDVVPVTHYDGLRFYLLAASCLPYLLLDWKNKPVFLLGVLPGFVTVFFCDAMLEMARVGYVQKGIETEGYALTYFRSIIAYLVINGSCISLKLISERTDGLNQELIAELKIKNQLIQEQADSELSQLNAQLVENLEAFSRREFVLNKSQEIAKVGSWEYRKNEKRLYWSNEMYNILGVDKNFDLTSPDLLTTLFGDAAFLIEDSSRKLFESRKPYDYTLQIRTPIGYKKWVRVSGFPLLDNDELIGASGIVHDITVYKESEELIRANEQKYRLLFEQASDAIMITDVAGNFVDVNLGLCNMLGYSRLELLLTNISALLDHAQDDEEIPFNQLAPGDQLFSERRMVRKDGSVVIVEANVKRFGEDRIMAIARDITSRKEVEEEKEQTRNSLQKRLKELSTLYAANQILNQEKKSIDEVLQELVVILPMAWQHAEICAAQITVHDKRFVTPNFTDSQIKQHASLELRGAHIGAIEIVYVADERVTGEDFLMEEYNLLQSIASMVMIYLARKREEEKRNESEANLRATINNTEILIWSVDREFKLLTYNMPFYRFIKEVFNEEIKIGSRVLGAEVTPENLALRKRWEHHYMRALSGELVTMEETIAGFDLHFSLSPIVESAYVLGVSVFAEDVTQRNRNEKALTEANKRIGELKLTALRSAMNPHFVFNALNSIQFFIARSDRLNAINYLSTFSKLIRGILSHSVSNNIKLSEEIELLQHYISLEQLRFDNRFSFTLNVDDELDLEVIEIPSLLIQPYVENAILHGLYNKSGPGALVISVRNSNSNGVLIEIEDDGIGRAAAIKLREQNFPKHKSMGIRLTEERLKLINAGENVSFEIEDLFHSGQAAGTRVKIWIRI